MQRRRESMAWALQRSYKKDVLLAFEAAVDGPVTLILAKRTIVL